MKGLTRICRPIVERALRDADTSEERRRKEIVIPVLLIGGIVSFLQAVADSFTIIVFRLRWWCAVVTWAACTAGICWPIARGSFTLELIGALCTGGSLRIWPMVILVMDMFLAVAMPKRYQMFVIHITGLWLIIDVVEREFRLGVYDIPSMTDTIRFWELCNCSTPPCGLGHLMFVPVGICGVLFMLYADYFATRSFAEGLQSEKCRAEASVLVADQVSAALAHFDLGTAASALDQAGNALPPKLLTSFQQLLANLASYRPYLPQSCFAAALAGSEGTDDGTEEDGRTSLGGLGHSIVCADSVESADSVSSSSAARTASDMSGRGLPAKMCVAQASGVRARPALLRRATLLLRNSCDFLQYTAQADGQAVSDALAAAVEGFIAVVGSRGGVPDLLSGDHLSATFGAVKAQGTHRLSATGAAVQLAAPVATGTAAQSGAQSAAQSYLTLVPEAQQVHSFSGEGRSWQSRRCSEARGPVTVAVCSGKALCGDFGSATAQRFMVLGPLSSFAPAVERAAAAWRMGTLIDAAVQQDADQSWECRLRRMVRFPKLGLSLIGLWEVVCAKQSALNADEWMYELENTGHNPWERYNAAVSVWCMASDPATALDAVTSGLDSGCSHSCKEALLAVRESIRQGLPPPVGDLTAAALAGRPAAVSSQPAALRAAEAEQRGGEAAAAAGKQAQVAKQGSTVPLRDQDGLLVMDLTSALSQVAPAQPAPAHAVGSARAT
eukprot:TRINITY_DN665_c3_g2_i3.p1 TRINITY_DN665_c3_g2~~TRINITY_DN665_c3_g2_i3.p1  ORF type:complete len:761 (+),score=166.51 TRINITY_DN665_c3_g2_i3:104-2284(+)